MIRKALLLYCLFLFACKSEKQLDKFSSPDKNDINEIVKTIVIKDHLGITDSPLSADLSKVKISFKDDKAPSSIDFSELNARWSLRQERNKKDFFSKVDSAYIFFQNEAIKSFKLDSPFSKSISLTNNTQVVAHRKNDVFFRHYEMTIPIFSLDKKRAFVALDYSCPLCGYGMYIYLERINGKWTIAKQEETWVS